MCRGGSGDFLVEIQGQLNEEKQEAGEHLRLDRVSSD